MTNTAPLRVLTGQTVHARFVPFEQRFRYRLFMVDIDIDALDAVDAVSPLFNINRNGLFSLKRSDHGDDAYTTWRDWAANKFAAAGVDVASSRIRLISFPRHLRYRFAPLSVWFAESDTGELQGVIYEVNNTFGESHAYVAPLSDTTRRTVAEKRFHVSPFFDVNGDYRFTLRKTDQRLSLIIDTMVEGQRQHMATLTANYGPATTGAFARAAILRPLNSIGITLGIHWEALKLWIRGAGYRSKPEPPRDAHTLAAQHVD